MVKTSQPHPYIPNSVPEVKREMLRLVGAESADELYREMIPERLLMRTPMRLPDALPDELGLRRHVESKLSRDVTASEYTSFLGGGCWQHYVPEVCETIAGRSEFLTAYAGGSHSDLGRFQANFEFQSLICELLGMEVPTTAAYVICVSVAGPALTELGLGTLQAHLFVFWFALLSTITPPVCGAVFIAAGMVEENWLAVAIKLLTRVQIARAVTNTFCVSSGISLRYFKDPFCAMIFISSGVKNPFFSAASLK